MYFQNEIARRFFFVVVENNTIQIIMQGSRDWKQNIFVIVPHW